MTSRFRFHKPQNIGLAVRRFVVFAAPVIVLVAFVAVNIVMGVFSPKTEETEEVIKATPVVVARAVARSVRLSVKAQGRKARRRRAGKSVLLLRSPARLSMSRRNLSKAAPLKKATFLFALIRPHI